MLTISQALRRLKGNFADAWNRLVEVNDGATPTPNVLATYQYDAQGRRIKEAAGGTTTDLYYSDDWQVLEERENGSANAKVQYVWSEVYVDALVLRDRDTGGPSDLDERVYVQQDANFNVTALVSAAGAVVERYVYDPYGAVTVLDGNWAAQAPGLYQGRYLHQGGRYDPVAGLYHFRRRDLSPTLGRWVQRDPIEFTAGDTNLYRFVFNSPTNRTDPSGLVVQLGALVVIGPVIIIVAIFLLILHACRGWWLPLVEGGGGGGGPVPPPIPPENPQQAQETCSRLEAMDYRFRSPEAAKNSKLNRGERTGPPNVVPATSCPAGVAPGGGTHYRWRVVGSNEVITAVCCNCFGENRRGNITPQVRCKAFRH